jgi:hypothetical protein
MRMWKVRTTVRNNYHLSISIVAEKLNMDKETLIQHYRQKSDGGKEYEQRT